LFAAIFSLSLFSVGSITNAESAKQPARGLPTLTTARRAHSLTDEQAKRAYPIHLRGVVTYFDPDSGSGYAAIFVHDSTGSIFVKDPSGSTPPLSAGAIIDVRGTSGPGGFGPIVVQPQIQVIGRTSLPANPPRETLPHLETGAEDAEWVEVEGVIRGVLEYSHSATLILGMTDGTVNVTIQREPGAVYSSLIDARVRIHANAAPTVNLFSQMVGVLLMAPNLAAVKVIEPAPGDPFRQPPTPIDRLLHWNQFSASFHRVHLRGSVTLQWPGSMLCIRDATRGICAQTTQTMKLALGDVVDVAGFVGTENNAPVLIDAICSRSGNNSLVAPAPITAEEALLGKYDSEPIQIDGQLIGYDHASADTTLLLSSGNTLFPVILPKSLAGREAGAWAIGSKLRISGICSVRIDAQSHAREGIAIINSFRVLMRSPGDVTVLESPSWWTPTHAIVMLALALTVTLGVLGWVAALRQRVSEQANLLRESEGRFRHLALHDPLTGLATRLLLQDRLNVALEGAERRNTGQAVLIADLDRFKEINDTYGHHAGDEVLRVTANRLLQSVRSEDTVARFGGDEFVVLLANVTDLCAVERIAAKIVETLALPISVGGLELPISVSLGVCTAAPGEFDADTLLRNADAALYQAKASGRNCFRLFHSDLLPSR
jgi:diguanylate cyclase (GGDEF)-like protein